MCRQGVTVFQPDSDKIVYVVKFRYGNIRQSQGAALQKTAAKLPRLFNGIPDWVYDRQNSIFHHRALGLLQPRWPGLDIPLCTGSGANASRSGVHIPPFGSGNPQVDVGITSFFFSGKAENVPEDRGVKQLFPPGHIPCFAIPCFAEFHYLK